MVTTTLKNSDYIIILLVSNRLATQAQAPSISAHLKLLTIATAILSLVVTMLLISVLMSQSWKQLGLSVLITVILSVLMTLLIVWKIHKKTD